MPLDGRTSLIGRVFGLWSVEAVADRPLYVQARCECGATKEVAASNLIRGQTKSCGCYRTALAGTKNLTHGRSRTQVYRIWKQMLKRCRAKDGVWYERYASRGIAVCARWATSFAYFAADFGPMPSPQHTIERIDNDRGYEPGNCRWATKTEQARNRSTTRLIAFGEITLCLAEWSEVTGLSAGIIRQRVDRDGWSVERALTTTGRTPRQVDPDHVKSLARDYLRRRGVAIPQAEEEPAHA